MFDRRILGYAALGCAFSSLAQAEAPSLATPYTQSFDGLAASGASTPWTNDVTLAGWYSSRTTYAINSGSSNTGSLYSYGTDTDRALGSVCSGSTGDITYGVQLINGTASAISALKIQYAGEQWREGGGTTPSLPQKLDFAYKVGEAAFVDFDALDFTGPHAGATSAGALDGNAERLVLSGTLEGLTLQPGQSVWLQWTDHNDTGNDHGLAIDDLRVEVAGTSTPTEPEPPGEPCTERDTPIGSVQSSGPSAVPGLVTVQGVVVGDYEGPSPALRGFYLQDQADSDPATSNAIFVFHGEADTVSLGDEVQVTGTAAEFQGQSQLAGVTRIELCGTGRTVAPTEIALPADDLERYEGMLVHFAQPLYVTEHFQLGRFGQVTVAANGRLRQPTNVAEPGADALAVQAANDKARILIDDALQSQNPDPIVFGRGGQPLSASNTLRGGDSVSGLTGVLTFTWAGNAASGNAWRVRPQNALGASLPNFAPTNPRPTAAPHVGGTLKVASFNLLNFFNSFGNACTFGVGGAAAECRGAADAAEFERQATKTVAAIKALNADVLGVIEMENDGYGPTSAIQELVNRVNAVVGAANSYAFIDFDARTQIPNAGGTDAIKVGILYKRFRVFPLETFADVDAVHNRNPLAQTFRDLLGGKVTVVINHFKSKGCDGASGEDLDQGDGQGCFNERRVKQASALLGFLDEVREANSEPDVLLLGDFNAYAKEDPLALLVAAGLTNLTLKYGGDSAYSYAFDGQWGYLDQAFATASAAAQVTGQADFHINSDEPSVLDYNVDFKSAGQVASLYAPDAYRTSDHDPVLVGLALKPNLFPVPPIKLPPIKTWLEQLLDKLFGHH
jgi:predicted extracellular nuclease